MPEQTNSEFVTDQPGLDPRSGRPWGEETPGKRFWGSLLLVPLAIAATVYVYVSHIPLGHYGSAGYVLGPVAVILSLVRLTRAWREMRTR